MRNEQCSPNSLRNYSVLAAQNFMWSKDSKENIWQV